MRTPKWVEEYGNVQESLPRMGPAGRAWTDTTVSWWRRWFKKHGIRVYDFSILHYEVYVWFRDHHGDQWFCWTGDCRFRAVNSLMLRKNDRRGPNRYVEYNNLFVENLEYVVLNKDRPWRGVEVIRPGW